MDLSHLIQKFDLSELPGEGGYFRRIYAATIQHDATHRAASCIYYAISKQTHSQWHKLQNDEIWTHCGGGTAIQLTIDVHGRLHRKVLDPEHPVQIVLQGEYQSTLMEKDSPEEYTLFSVTAIPEYTDSDIELFQENQILELFPHLKKDWDALLLK